MATIRSIFSEILDSKYCAMAMIMQRSRKNVRLSEVSDYRAEKQISRVPNFFLQYLWFLFTDFNSSLKIFLHILRFLVGSLTEQVD